MDKVFSNLEVEFFKMSTSNTKAGGGKSAATEDVASSTITALSHQSSDFSSQGTSSQGTI